MKTLMKIAILILVVLIVSPTAALAKSAGVSTIQISQTAIDFGQVKLNTKTPIRIQVSNTGNATLSITAMSLQGALASEFSLSTSGPLSVAAGKQSILTINFTPKQLGAASAAISIVSNDPNSPATVQLQGTGVQAQLAVNNSPIAFGHVVVGSQSSPSTLNLQNTGNIPLNITSMTFNGTGASAFGMSPAAPITISPSSSANVSIWFIATSAGSRAAKLNITTDGVPASATIALSGTGVVLPSLQVNTNNLDFGQVKLTTKAPMQIQISNAGSEPLDISSITLQGAQASEFKLSTSGPLTVAAGKQSTLTVNFVPQQLGAATAAVNIASNDVHSPASLQLKGEGVQAQLAVDKSPIKFGQIVVGSQSSPSTLNLQNTGNIPLNITSMTFTGTGASAFGMSPAAPITISPSSSANVSIWFIPTSAGSRAAKLNITTDGVPASVNIALSGTGVVLPSEGSQDPQ